MNPKTKNIIDIISRHTTMATPPSSTASQLRWQTMKPCFLVTMIVLSLLQSVNSWTFDRSVALPAKNTVSTLTFDSVNKSPRIDRRSMLLISGVAVGGSICMAPNKAEAADNTLKDISQRLEDDILLQPPVSAGSRSGSDNTFFPDFLEGTWDVTQTLTAVKTPLGLSYIGGPNGLESIAEKSLAESQKYIGEPVKLRLSFVKTRLGVAEDRVFNAASRLNGFAGKTVVASVDYADLGASNRAAVIAAGGTATDPLQTVVVRFKGPAAQKIFVTSHGSQVLSENAWAGYEGQRSIFALTNESTAPPIFTDSESIYRFERTDDRHVSGKLRLAGYLNAQSDKLYFDARNRAVSIQDYTLEMVKVLD
jgi:hypothetical protein